MYDYNTLKTKWNIISTREQQLQELIKLYPKVSEFEVAVKASLLNWTSSAANKLISYSICNGFDAWNTLYTKYVPLAEYLQHTYEYKS